MPRGNDETAARDLAAKHGGEGVGNAEELIRMVQESRSPELELALAKSVDEAATAALDLSTLSGPNGEPVVAAAVRGGMTVIVYEDSTGAYSKAIATEKSKKAVVKPSAPKSDKK
jgi:hypothetical protein